MFGKFILLFIIVPIIELFLLIEVGKYLGTLNTVLLVVITGIIGGTLAKFEGLRVWRQLQDDLINLKMPTDSMIDGVLVLIGGVMLITPGILTDLFGLFLIIPLTRLPARIYLKKRFAGKTKNNIKVIDI